MKYRKGRHKLGMLAAILLLSTGLTVCWPGAPSAEASYISDVYNGMKKFSELPSDVNKLKEQYTDTEQQLQNAESSLDSYRQQNEQLAEQNRILSETVSELNAANEARKSTTHKLRIMLYTALGLFVGYFIFIRVVRLKLRR